MLARVVARHLPVISAVEVCNGAELLFWYIWWRSRKIRSDSTVCCTSNAKPGDKIRESDDIKIPVYCDNNTNGNFESEHVYAG